MLRPLSSTSFPSIAQHQQYDPQNKEEMFHDLMLAHGRFALAFKLNDPALILPFLDKDIVLVAPDGVQYTGVNAVLGHLVDPTMSKLSAKLRVKGRPLQTGSLQSMILYEHGFVLKQPRMIQVIEWKPSQCVIVKMTHTLMLKKKDQKKTSLRRRWSIPTLLRGASINTTRQYRHSTSSLSGLSSSSLASIAILTRLTPIRKRKVVQPFVTIESVQGQTLWTSSTAKKIARPRWHRMDLLPFPIHDPIVFSLWDYGFFHSVRVATKTITLGQLMATVVDKRIHIQLQRIEGINMADTIEMLLTVKGTDRSVVKVDDIMSFQNTKPTPKVCMSNISAKSISQWWVVIGILTITTLLLFKFR